MAIAVGTLAMLLGNVGLQVFNNWCNNRQNDELQRKREEFERAAREHQTDRMWKILREGQALTLELEETKQKQRKEELESEMGQLLQTLAYQATIENWPLGVLPIVMKNQALGNLLAHQEESFALHCIFTPSNYSTFNKCVFPRIEQALEEYCNKYWSPASTHPILFYSGAWKSNDAPSGTQTNSMRSALSNLPTLMITPFFRPTDGKLVFQIQMWGVGASSTDQFDVPEIEPKSDEFHFQRTYTNELDYEKEAGLLDEIVEDLVPYLQCLIGFMADTYFWSSAGLKPQLPHLVTDGTINTDGMKYLVSDSREYYNNLLLTGEERAKENPFAQDNLLNLYEGSAELWDEEANQHKYEEIFVNYCRNRSGKNYSDINDAISNHPFTPTDIAFLKKYFPHSHNGTQRQIKRLLSILERINFDYSLLNSIDIKKLEDLSQHGNSAAMFRLGEIYEYSIGIEKYDSKKAVEYYGNSLNHGFVLAEIYSMIHDKNSESVRLFTEEELLVLNNLHTQGVVTASILLSQYYYYGPEKDKNKVIKYLEDAPDTNHPYLYYWAAKILLDFRGEKEEKSFEYNLEKAADFGYIEAQLLLMNWYQKKGNPEKTFYYARKAANQGSVKGISKVGYCMLTGYGTNKDKKRGVEMLRFAAQKGDKIAIELLKNI